MDDLERALRRYRPVGPPPELRGQVTTRRRSSLVEWLPAVAAAALVVMLYGRSAHARGELMQRIAATQVAREAALNDLAISLGGDVQAHQEAERLSSLGEQTAVANDDPTEQMGLAGGGHE